MTDEDVFTVDGVGGTVAGSFPFFLVALDEEGASAVQHILTFAVEIRSLNALAAAYGYAVVALGTTTAVVPRYEEVVPSAVLEDERCLDGIAACEA